MNEPEEPDFENFEDEEPEEDLHELLGMVTLPKRVIFEVEPSTFSSNRQFFFE